MVLLLLFFKRAAADEVEIEVVAEAVWSLLEVTACGVERREGVR